MAAAVALGASPAGAAAHGPTQHFRSAPALRPPLVSATGDSDTSSGDIFLAPQNSPQVGPMILDSHGRLVWFHPLRKGSPTYYAANLEVQHYQGQPVLTWWQGENLGSGEDVIMSRSYRTIAVIHAGDGFQPDLHEFQITPQGTALIDVLEVKRADLTSAGGPANGAVLDNVIQEVDIRTEKVVWQWHALGHIPLSASYERYSSKAFWYDAFHLNSIQQLPGGNLLISVRNTWAVYEISRRTGAIIWTLGGKASSFAMGPGTNFEWQHDAHLYPGGMLSVFDDASDNTQQEERQSSAKVLKIYAAARTAMLARRFIHAPPLVTGVSGSVQRLANGNVFVGWGEQSDFSEYSPSGRQIFDASLPLGVGSYRAYRFRWAGEPQTRPSIVVARAGTGRAKVHVSWNGATRVSSWRVLGGPSPRELKPLGVTARRAGFETSIELRAAPRYVAVQALDPSGRALRTSVPARG